MSLKNLAVAFVIGAALAAGIFVAVNIGDKAELKTAFEIPIPGALPEFSLLDQHGNAVNAATFRDHWDLVFFGFTHCPDVCPTTLQLLASVKKTMRESGAEILPRIILVSVDPERDTPELMGKYLNYFGTDNLGITGELTEIRKLTAGLGIYFEKSPADGDNYGVDHSAAVILIDTHGKFSALFSGPHTIDGYLHDLPILMNQMLPGTFHEKETEPLEEIESGPPLVASGVEVTQPVPGRMMSAGYLELRNNSDASIEISEVSSPSFGSVEIHESTMEDGISRMRRIDALIIPANSTVTLERGGKHLMLMDAGVIGHDVSLNFYGNGILLLSVTVPVVRKDN